MQVTGCAARMFVLVSSALEKPRRTQPKATRLASTRMAGTLREASGLALRRGIDR
jgi:hypothetical protein